MHLRKIAAVVLILFCVWVSRTQAIPGRLPDLEKIVVTSTLIVVGELVSVQQGVRSTALESSDLKARFGLELSPAPRVNVRVDRGSFRTLQVLKGDVPAPSITVDFWIPEEFIGWTVPSQGAYGVFFFRNAADGALEFTDPYFPGIPVARGLNAGGSGTLEKVVDLLGASLSGADRSSESRIAILWLEFSKSSISNQALRRALGNPDFVIQLDAARALTWKSDPAGLELIKATFLPRPRVLPDNLEVTIANAVGAGLRDAKFIPELEDLQGSLSVYMRRGAAEALMKAGSPGASRGLRRALEDTDLQIRYYGVVGLADIAGEKLWRPSIEEFRSDEFKYLNHWKAAAVNQQESRLPIRT